MALTSQGKLSHQHEIWNCQLLENSKILKNSVTNGQKKAYCTTSISDSVGRQDFHTLNLENIR
jgi:hypothetical protein